MLFLLNCQRWFALAAAFAVSVPLAGFAEETAIAWKFTKGDKLLVTREQNTVSQTSVANKPVRTTVDTTVDMTWTVHDVDEQGAAQITQSLDRIQVKMDAGHGLVEFDSASKEKPVAAVKTLADGVLPLVGGTFEITMTRRGEMLGLKPSEKLAKLLGSKLDDAGIAKLLQQPLVLLPEKAVEPAASWETQRTLPSSLGDLRQTLTYKFAGLGDDTRAKLARLEIAGVIAAPKPTANLPKLKSNELTGSADFDTAAGRLVEMTVTQTLEVTSVYSNTPLAVKTESKVATKVKARE